MWLLDLGHVSSSFGAFICMYSNVSRYELEKVSSVALNNEWSKLSLSKTRVDYTAPVLRGAIIGERPSSTTIQYSLHRLANGPIKIYFTCRLLAAFRTQRICKKARRLMKYRELYKYLRVSAAPTIWTGFFHFPDRSPAFTVKLIEHRIYKKLCLLACGSVTSCFLL